MLTAYRKPFQNLANIKEISLKDISEYIPLTKAEGMAGFSTHAIYYGVFSDMNVLIGFTSIQYYSGKAKFNNHFIFKPFRKKGLFKQLMDYSIMKCRDKGIHTIVATCTAMSLPEYLKRGASITKQYKKYTAVTLSV